MSRALNGRGSSVQHRLGDQRMASSRRLPFARIDRELPSQDSAWKAVECRDSS